MRSPLAGYETDDWELGEADTTPCRTLGRRHRRKATGVTTADGTTEPTGNAGTNYADGRPQMRTGLPCIAANIARGSRTTA